MFLPSYHCFIGQGPGNWIPFAEGLRFSMFAPVGFEANWSQLADVLPVLSLQVASPWILLVLQKFGRWLVETKQRRSQLSENVSLPDLLDFDMFGFGPF